MIRNVIVAGLLLLALGDPGDPTGEGFQNGRTAGVSLKDSEIVVTGTGVTGTGDGYRVKRPCWYEPRGNAADMLDSETDKVPQGLPETELRRRVEALKQFKDKVGQEGTWWQRAYNSADPGGMACVAGLAEPYVFAPPGTTPAGGITIEELVDIARAALTVPEPKIKLSPDAKSYVNLPTWVWLDGGRRDHQIRDRDASRGHERDRDRHPGEHRDRRGHDP